jgi:hypothetical protein
MEFLYDVFIYRVHPIPETDENKTFWNYLSSSLALKNSQKIANHCIKSNLHRGKRREKKLL